jgi:hypothetical protein
VSPQPPINFSNPTVRYLKLLILVTEMDMLLSEQEATLQQNDALGLTPTGLCGLVSRAWVSDMELHFTFILSYHDSHKVFLLRKHSPGTCMEVRGEAHLTEAEAVAEIGVGVSKHVRRHDTSKNSRYWRSPPRFTPGAREQPAGRPSCRAVGDGDPIRAYVARKKK